MPQEIRLWKVAGDALTEVPRAPLDLESRLEEWLRNDISVLGLDVVVIGQQVKTDFGGFIDLLCIDSSGDLVVVELKRDKTPREISAQVLDYGSWVVDLSAEDIAGIADGYLGKDSLEKAFREAFDSDLPDSLNQDHQLVIVGADIDPRSERIVRYLSDSHGVSVNAITFQYFEPSEGEEYLGRVFLLEPAEVESRAKKRGGSKRRSTLTREELESIAEENGVADLYEKTLSVFEPSFWRSRTTRSSIRFETRDGKRRYAVFNVIPTASEAGRLHYQLYTARAAAMTGLSAEDVVDALPPDSSPWAYAEGADEWWRGHAGYFQNEADVTRLAEVLGVRPPGSP